MKYAPGKQKLTKAVAINEEEKEAFRQLVDRGVDVYIQMVPNDKTLKMEQFLS